MKAMHFSPLKAKDLLNKADWRKEATKEPREAEEGTEHFRGNFFSRDRRNVVGKRNHMCVFITLKVLFSFV